MAWTLQPCAGTSGRSAVICDTDSTILARIDGPAWDEKGEQLDDRLRPAALLMTAAPVLFWAVQAFVDACGGNPPDWLKSEHAAAERALLVAGGQRVADPIREALEAAEHWLAEEAESKEPGATRPDEILRTIRAALGKEV